DPVHENFYGAAYYGGYFSQFAQRAIGAATGMIDPHTWEGQTGPLGFYTATPCRLLDTPTTAAMASGQAQTITVAGSCGIPSQAGAVSANLTVTQPTSSGSLIFYPNLGPAPATSTISFSVGQTRANNAILYLDSRGQGTVQVLPALASSGTVQLIV